MQIAHVLLNITRNPAYPQNKLVSKISSLYFLNKPLVPKEKFLEKVVKDG
jgi:hypothetical protein